MEYKYTDNRKKVTIIEEMEKNYLVQEIFIADGIEFPSGDKFTVSKSRLFDECPKTWEEKQTARNEHDYKVARQRYEKEVADLRYKQEQDVSILKEKITHIEGIINTDNEYIIDALNMISNVMLENYEYVVYDNNIYTKDEFINKKMTLSNDCYGGGKVS